MKTQITTLAMLIIVLISSGNLFATDDFQIRPPIMVEDNRTKLKLVTDEESGKQVEKEDVEYFMRAPSVYYSFGIQTESTWFDRRLNWSSYSTQLVVDTGITGYRYQGSLSSVGRDEFVLFDSRFDIYAYWDPEILPYTKYGTFKIGGGISYFDIEPYESQEFLFKQHYGVFANLYCGFIEIKYVWLFNKAETTGHLFEFKIFNPFLYLGFHAPESSPQNGLHHAFVSVANLFVPFELGITGSIDLPNNAEGWGWYVKGRYALLDADYPDNSNNIEVKKDQVPHLKVPHLSTGIEFYWSYREGFGTSNVSRGWEFGIKYTVIGF